MFCPNCGNQVKDGGKFCSKCGCRIDVIRKSGKISHRDSDSKMNEFLLNQIDTFNDPPEKNRKSKKSIIVAVIVIVVLAVMLIIGCSIRNYIDLMFLSEDTTDSVVEVSNISEVDTNSIFDIDEDVAEGNIITFGNYEQDNNLDNGKEPIEWIVLKKEDRSYGNVIGLPVDAHNHAVRPVLWLNL